MWQNTAKTLLRLTSAGLVSSNGRCPLGVAEEKHLVKLASIAIEHSALRLELLRFRSRPMTSSLLVLRINRLYTLVIPRQQGFVPCTV